MQVKFSNSDLHTANLVICLILCSQGLAFSLVAAGSQGHRLVTAFSISVLPSKLLLNFPPSSVSLGIVGTLFDELKIA